MGLIDKLLGGAATVTAAGNAARGLAEVFTPNATAGAELSQAAYLAALGELGKEFELQPAGPFDRLMNGLNRLPRPTLALGTLGLFVYAMAAPASFAVRMQGLQTVPEPLWWLLGAIVSFYFGAREAHYFRLNAANAAAIRGAAAAAPEAAPPPAAEPNSALDDWLTQREAGR